MGRRHAGAGALARGAVLSLLAILLLAPLSASVSAAETGDDLSLVIDISPMDNEVWYSDSQNLDITISVRNDGDSTVAFEYNPSCPVELNMFSQDELFTSLNDHRNCRQQRRAVDIMPQQTRTLDTFDWDWTNGMEDLISSGAVTIDFDYETGTLTESIEFEFQRSPIAIDNLVLEMSTAPPPAGKNYFESGDSLWSFLSLRNIGSDAVNIAVDEGCRVAIQTLGTTVNPVELTELGCAAGTVIPAGQSQSLGWLNWDFTHAGQEVQAGQWTVSASLSGIVGTTASMQIEFMPAETVESAFDLSVQVIGDGGQDGVLTLADSLLLRPSLSNPTGEPLPLQFNSSCQYAIRIISQDGGVVIDDALAQDCEESFESTKVDPQDSHLLPERVWEMTDSVGCELNNGDYMLILTVPEQGLVTTYPFTYQGSGEGEQCRAGLQDSSAVRMTVENMQVENIGTVDEQVRFNLRLSTFEEFDIYWPQECRLLFSLRESTQQDPDRVWFEECGQAAATTQTFTPAEPLEWGSFVVEMGDLQAGTWVLMASTTGTPQFSAQWARTWIPPQQQSEEQNENLSEPIDESEEFVEENVPAIAWVAEGHWNYVTTEIGGCWLLTTLDGTEHALAASHVSGWSPVPHLEGAYMVTTEDEALAACQQWSAKLTVTEVIDERVVAPQEDDDDGVLPATAPVAKLPISTPAIAALVATTSLLTILIGFVTQVEWLRLPATKWGLAVVGLVRTNKDRGGEYQRGRIVAYIELHRGIHFRALLEALNMSNGQLTHHLSVLETQERIWRRKDGRKVRYYPETVDSKTPDEELPVPVLQPDPDSLQGRILYILDIHENDIINLSQKELAIKLETSQQLVSYHLKALEQWGLIEKEKVALRFRYRLTDRALLLLNTGDLSPRDEP